MSGEQIYACEELQVTWKESGMPMGMAMQFRCMQGMIDDEDAWLTREQSLVLAAAIHEFWKRREVP